MNRFITTLLLISILCFSCKSDYQKEVEKSKKITVRLKMEKLPSCDSLYNQIINRETNPNSHDHLLDSLYLTTKEITNLLDSLSVVVEKSDPTGERRDIGKSLLATSPSGLRLTKGVNSIYKYCLEIIEDADKEKSLKKLFSKYRGYLGSGEFNQVYFSQSSTSFILMTLTGLKNDLIKATYLAMYGNNEITTKTVRPHNKGFLCLLTNKSASFHFSTTVSSDITLLVIRF